MHKYRLTYTYNGEWVEVEGECSIKYDDAAHILKGRITLAIPDGEGLDARELLKYHGYENPQVYWVKE